jgi:hypothetical protein
MSKSLMLNSGKYVNINSQSTVIMHNIKIVILITLNMGTMAPSPGIKNGYKLMHSILHINTSARKLRIILFLQSKRFEWLWNIVNKYLLTSK